MQPAPHCPAPAPWWRMWASGLLLHWHLQLGAYAVVFFCFLFFPLLMLPSEIPKTPHRHGSERVSYCLETFPLSGLPPQDGSQSWTLLSCIFPFQRKWAAFLGAWGPPPVFRSCFVKVAQHSNDLLMNLWGRKWSPHPIPPPSSVISLSKISSSCHFYPLKLQLF